MRRLELSAAALLLALAVSCTQTKDDSSPSETGEPDVSHDDSATERDSTGDSSDSGDSASPPVDADGDGATADLDCDDADANVHPDASEVCDAADNDCDGAVDGEGICPCDTSTYGGHVYLFCDESLAWSEAGAWCESYGYGLAKVEDAAENSWLASEGYAWGGGQYYWICASDEAEEGIWTCRGEGLDYTNWNADEPNDSYGVEECAVLQPPEAVWNDRSCGAAGDIWFICEAG